jgi:hypothetical protein
MNWQQALNHADHKNYSTYELLFCSLGLVVQTRWRIIANLSPAKNKQGVRRIFIPKVVNCGEKHFVFCDLRIIFALVARSVGGGGRQDMPPAEFVRLHSVTRFFISFRE